MALSSNSVIHFTDKKESLHGILLNNFKLSYCIEELILDDKPISFAVPIVSFCDIPLSEIKNHIDKYGHYGLGLTKNWAIKKKLNPVLYMQTNSQLSASYRRVYLKYILDPHKTIVDLDETEKSIVDILRYIKNYQNDLKRGQELYKNYRFSDEREWRYALDYNESARFIYSLNGFNKDEQNKSLESYRLEFEPNDIKYVIIQDESEISEFIEVLKSAKGKSYSYQDVERLLTRIITTKQIMEDF